MLVRDIEKALTAAEQNGAVFGNRTLSKGALVHLCRRLDNTRSWNILEMGGGQSPVFWEQLHLKTGLSLLLSHLEHDPGFAAIWEEKPVGEGFIHFYRQTLQQLSDEERNEVFASPEVAMSVWSSYGKPVSPELFNHYTIRNAFFAEVDMLPLEQESVDILIVDGPHGNGRSLAFPLFYKHLKPDAFVLVDDYDHYPFIEDLRSLFHMEELFRDTRGDCRWLLGRLTGKRSFS